MNFMTILNSLDELLYEVMSWLVFYPVTLWRAITRPLGAMAYAHHELSDPESKRFTDALSPPIFLLISILISHAIEIAVIGDDAIIGSRKGLDILIDSDTNLIALRMFSFALFPMINALRMVRANRIKLDRETLKLPFYSQCYVTAPMALLLGIATTLGQCRPIAAQEIALGLMTVTVIWYVAIQTVWFHRQLKSGWPRAFGNALRAYVEALIVLFLVSALIGS